MFLSVYLSCQAVNISININININVNVIMIRYSIRTNARVNEFAWKNVDNVFCCVVGPDHVGGTCSAGGRRSLRRGAGRGESSGFGLIGRDDDEEDRVRFFAGMAFLAGMAGRRTRKC